jgi:hypothetical protein
MEKPDGSALHKLRSSIREGRFIYFDSFADDEERPIWPTPPFQDFTSFVVEHDWAAAFANATDFSEGDFRIPFEFSCFEFRYSGKRICALVGDTEIGRTMHPIVQTKVGWLLPRATYVYADGKWSPAKALSDDNYGWLVVELGRQVRAICIALEAEAAVTEVVRAPTKLNAARLRRGAFPLVDYHVVSLTRRVRAEPLEGHDTTGHRKRLHFVRGHWRHYPSHKAWIKWHLRGDPDLGFIDKHYKL